MFMYDKKRLLVLAILIMGPLLLFQNCSQPYDIKVNNLSSATTGVGQITDPNQILPSSVEPLSPPVIGGPPSTIGGDPTVGSGGTSGHGDQPPTNIGKCIIHTDHGVIRQLSFANVKKSDFKRENESCLKSGEHNNGEDKDQDEGTFLAPSSNGEATCMTRKACEGIIASYLQYTGGVLLAKPHQLNTIHGQGDLNLDQNGENLGNDGEHDDDNKFVKFKPDEDCKITEGQHDDDDGEHKNTHILSDDQVKLEILKLITHWQKNDSGDK